MSSNREPMLDLYIFETTQQIEKLEQTVLDSEQATDMQVSINEIFRIMHTIKGNSAMMLFNNISELAHSMEDLFDHLRETKCWMHQGFDYIKISDLVLEGIDFIKGELDKINNNQSADGDAASLIGRIRKLLEENKSDNPSSEQQKEEKKRKKPKYYISSQKGVLEDSETTYDALVFFEEGCEMEDIRAFTLVHSVKEIASEVKYHPEDILENSESKEYIIKNGFKLTITSSQSIEEVRELFNRTPFLRSFDIEKAGMKKKEQRRIILDDNELEDKAPEQADEYIKQSSDAKSNEGFEVKEDVSKIEAVKTAEAEVNVSRSAPSVGQAVSSAMISVNVSKLDQLLDLVGELVISEAMVTRNPDLAGLQLDSFYKSARQLRKITNELQDIAMSIRMVSLAPTFSKMNRLVRDMSKKIGKQVNLELVGQDTEVDKNIIENIGDPLMHLIRNAIDHGIETMEERLQAGKSPTGSITLEARNSGGDVWIEVKDDGRGLSREKIYNKAFEHGLTAKRLEELSDREIFSFIFLPGFSTKEKVTEFSGRGVGMDVVQKNIEKVRGTIQVESTLGKGTTIAIKIPLTLSIIDGMTIKVGESRYTIPITSIKESLRISNEQVVKDLSGNEMIILRGESLPIIRLHKLYSVNTLIEDLQEGIIIVVESENKTVCLFVDELIGEQQVVVKTLPNYVKNVRGVAGCTILGDGGISLILNIQGLMNTQSA